jgi:pyruvate kinase
MVDIFGTLGPACDDEKVLCKMFATGMTGIRINLSHVMLSECMASIDRIRSAAKENGITPKILIDMQGPELRIGKFDGAKELASGDMLKLGRNGIAVSGAVLAALESGDEVLLDDGKILGKVAAVSEDSANVEIIRGGELTQKKSLAIKGKTIELPAITEDDRENLRLAKDLGITGIMQPFVRSRKDLEEVRSALHECCADNLKTYAKIENLQGLENIESFIDLSDEIIIARGDLGNSMPLWQLPHAQKRISKICNDHQKPFMVVTQMLASMEKKEVPTRAEVSDIYNAVLDGAASVMVTGETAIGVNPVEVIRYLHETVMEAFGHPEDRR